VEILVIGGHELATNWVLQENSSRLLTSADKLQSVVSVEQRQYPVGNHIPPTTLASSTLRPILMVNEKRTRQRSRSFFRSCLKNASLWFPKLLIKRDSIIDILNEILSNSKVTIFHEHFQC